MKGKIKFSFRVGKRNYNFVLTRNITIIHDKSSTGKTSLVRDLHLYKRNAVSVRYSKKFSLDSDGYRVEILDDERWEDVFARRKNYRNTIFIIDEYSSFTPTNMFSEFVADTGSYFIIISRRPLSNLAYSVNSVYELDYDKESYQYTLRQKYVTNNNDVKNNFYIGTLDTLKPTVIIAEDSNSGFQFFNSLDFKCISAKGNTNVFSVINDNIESDLMVIADGAAFGCCMFDIFNTYKGCNIHLYLPESFEYLVLNSKIFKQNGLQDKLKNTYDYVEYNKYISWERYFTSLLLDLSNNTELQYAKKRLNTNYLKDANVCKILKENRLCALCKNIRCNNNNKGEITKMDLT